MPKTPAILISLTALNVVLIALIVLVITFTSLDVEEAHDVLWVVSSSAGASMRPVHTQLDLDLLLGICLRLFVFFLVFLLSFHQCELDNVFLN